MTLKEWLQTAAAELDVTDVDLDDEAVQIVLDLARDAAHEVERVAAPLTTFLVGVAVGRGATLATAAETTTTRLFPPGAATSD